MHGHGPTPEALLRLLAATPDALLVVDGRGVITFASDRTEDLFGYRPHEAVGLRLAQLLPEGVLEPEVAGCRADGSTFVAEVSQRDWTACGDCYLLVVVRDVTGRLEHVAERLREKILNQAEQAGHLESLGELAGGVAHDFNNLLGVIMNYSSLVARRVNDAHALADLTEVDAAARRAAGLTQQILNFAGRAVAHPSPLEVNEVVGSVASMLRRTVGEHVRLEVTLSKGPLIALADRNQLEQIVLNLVLNARDAMPAGGLVSVTTGVVARTGDAGLPDDVEIVVQDTGTGMDPAVAAQAFEPFFTTKPPGMGTGLGLSTVAGIVKRFGGEVSLDTEPGTGTTVTVTLRGGERPRATVRAPGRPLGGRERILLAEDDQALRVATKRVLEANGYDVVVAADGDEALALAERDPERIDLVLADVAMPGLRGDELAARLDEIRPGLPLVYTSGYGAHETADGRPVLPKPVPEGDLLLAIREVLDAR